MGGHEHQRYSGIMACIKMRGFLRCRICRHPSLASAWPPKSFSPPCRSSPVLIVCLHFYGLKELLRSLGRLYGSFSRRNEGHREDGMTLHAEGQGSPRQATMHAPSQREPCLAVAHL